MHTTTSPVSRAATRYNPPMRFAPVPGYRMHPLKGTLADYWSVRVSGKLRIVFRFRDGEPVDVDLIDYHWETRQMNAMANPPHPGETVRFDCVEAAGLTVTEAARRLGCSRPALSRILNGRAAISPEMALALEAQGWSNADFWMRRQAAYDLAQARRRTAAV